MGMYDTVMVPCPKCGKKSGFQTKSGDCTLEEYEIENVPYDVIQDVMRHGPATCDSCGTVFGVQFKTVAIVAAKSVEWPPKDYDSMTPEEQWEHDKFNGTLDDEACPDCAGAGSIGDPANRCIACDGSGAKE